VYSSQRIDSSITRGIIFSIAPGIVPGREGRASVTTDSENTTAEKVRENRLRRMAQRQGLLLQKSRRRDPRAIDYGRWLIVDPNRNAIVAGEPGRWTLDDVERFLTG
jgi:hypothetical protein